MLEGAEKLGIYHQVSADVIFFKISAGGKKIGHTLAGWAAAARAGDEACPGECQTGPGEHCTALVRRKMRKTRTSEDATS